MKSRNKIFLNGGQFRGHNNRIKFLEEGGEVQIQFAQVAEDAKNPAVLHEVIRGKVRLSVINIDSKGMDNLVLAWIEYQKFKAKHKE